MSTETGKARILSRAVPPEEDGRRVKSLLKSELHMAEGYIAALKLRPDGKTRWSLKTE